MELLEEYDHLLKRFNKAFGYEWEKGDKMDLAFARIINRLSEIECEIKGIEADNKKGIWYANT